MSLSLLHVSDIHPSASDDLVPLAHEISSTVKRNNCLPTFIVASGDLGLKGSNQQLSAKFLLTLASDLGLGSKQIVCVPGNHDVEKGNFMAPFHNYSNAVYTITKDSARTIASDAALYRHDGMEFLLINSAYHLDIAYGKVNCDALRKTVAELSTTATKIVVVHHNAIPVDENDRSTITNAYEFLTIVSSVGCEVVLHGHQHVSLSLVVGSGTKLVGVGTVNFIPATNVNNQFNVVDVGKRVLRFRYHADSSTSRGVGNWDREELPW
jgi:3',5'-cyclic AMP phosphodiesterase CpdA